MDEKILKAKIHVYTESAHHLIDHLMRSDDEDVKNEARSLANDLLSSAREYKKLAEDIE